MKELVNYLKKNIDSRDNNSQGEAIVQTRFEWV